MSRLPVNQPYSITTQFGVPDSNAKFGKHSGLDFAVPSGRSVYAPCNGQLTNVVSNTGGNMVVIFDGKYYHRLMHNSSFIRNNGPVNEGAEVALAGTTGLSTGVHCHWDVNSEGTYPTTFNSFIDPNIWLKKGNDMYDGKTAEQWYLIANDWHKRADDRQKVIERLENEVQDLKKRVADLEANPAQQKLEQIKSIIG